MALAHAFYRVTIDFTETSGKTVRRTYRTNSATVTSLALATTAAQGLAPDLAAITNSVINQMIVEDVYTDTNALPSAAENSDQALISAKLVGKPNQSGVLSVPAAKAAIFVAATGAGYDVVDIANADVLTFLDHFVTGADFVISDGDLIVESTAAGRRRNVHSLGT